MSETTTGSEGRPTGYRVLARKYRPKDFSDLMVGQEPMVRTLTNAFDSGRIAQAYMLTGVRGVGKTTTARILARALNYKTATIDRPTIDLREPGEHCQAIMDGRHVDVVEMDAASHTGIDDIRDIIEQVRYRPVSARYKVFIIDEVHMLSTQAFNGLLKTLEEPPEHVKFIFATTEIRKVPITVLSRCQRFDLRRIPAADLVGLFSTIAEKEGIVAEADALALIARAAEGSARDGLSLLDQAIAHGSGHVAADQVRAMLGLADRSRIVDLFGQLIRGDIVAALAEFGSQYEAGANPVVVLTDLADFTHFVTRLKYVPDAAGDVSLSEVERTSGADFAASVAVSTLSRFWQMLLKGIPEVENAARPFGAAEMVLIRLAHAANLPGPEEAIRRLQSMGAETGQPASAAATTSSGPSASSPPRGASGSPSQSGPHGSSATMAVAETRSLAGAGQDGPSAMLRTVASNPEPVAAPRPETPQALPKVPVKSLTDIVELCTEHRDVRLRALVRTCVKLVRLEPGRLEIGLTPDAPKALIGDLGRRLEEWTGMRWVISISREEGTPTLAETEARARDERVSDARADPDVAAILARFPGAKITDVRVHAGEAEAEETILPSRETAEGDILPADDIE